MLKLSIQDQAFGPDGRPGRGRGDRHGRGPRQRQAARPGGPDHRRRRLHKLLVVPECTAPPALRPIVSPRGHWEITSWSATGDDVKHAAARLLVIRRGSDPGSYRMHKTSAIRDIPANKTRTFKSSIKVRGGDRLGLASIGNLPVQYSRPAFPKQDKAGSTQPTPQPSCLYPLHDLFGTGTLCPLTTQGAKTRVNVAATIERRT